MITFSFSGVCTESALRLRRSLFSSIQVSYLCFVFIVLRSNTCIYTYTTVKVISRWPVTPGPKPPESSLLPVSSVALYDRNSEKMFFLIVNTGVNKMVQSVLLFEYTIKAEKVQSSEHMAILGRQQNHKYNDDHIYIRL